jgi:hypothetical protein
MLERRKAGPFLRLNTQNDKKREQMKKTLFFSNYLNYRMCISQGIFPANRETDND